MGNMVVCSSLVIGAAKGGSRALNWIHPTWSTCAELHNVRETHLIRWGNKSNKQRCSVCHTQQAQGRKEGRKEGAEKARAGSGSQLCCSCSEECSGDTGWKCRAGSSVHVMVGCVCTHVCHTEEHRQWSPAVPCASCTQPVSLGVQGVLWAALHGAGADAQE